MHTRSNLARCTPFVPCAPKIAPPANAPLAALLQEEKALVQDGLCAHFPSL